MHMYLLPSHLCSSPQKNNKRTMTLFRHGFVVPEIATQFFQQFSSHRFTYLKGGHEDKLLERGSALAQVADDALELLVHLLGAWGH